jgi:Spy/CpxP family protein refolding chaperone
MKKIDHNFKLLVAIIIVLGISLCVTAQPQQRRQMPQRDHMAQSGFQHLNLTDEQKDQIKQIRQSHLKNVQSLKDEVKINRAKVDALLHKDDPDMKQIVSLVEANGKLLTQIQINRIEQKIAVRSLLTEEQKTIFDAHSERMGRRKALAEHYRHRNYPGRKKF